MKTQKMFGVSRAGRAAGTLAAGSLALMVAGVANANIYVTNSGLNTVSEYTNSGTLLNGSFISGSLISGPSMIAASGNDLFVASNNNGTVGEYNASTGAAVNASFVSGLNTNAAVAVAVSGNYLFVGQDYGAGGAGGLAAYNITTGQQTWSLPTATSSSLLGTYAIAVSGGDLFVANVDSGTVSEYNAATGATLNASLITGPFTGDYYGTAGNTVFSSSGGSSGLAVSGSNLYVANYITNTINEYAISPTYTASAVRTINTYNPLGITILGSDIYATSYSGAAVNEFTTSGTAVAAATYTENGVLVNSPLIAGLSKNGPTDLVVTPAPLPGSGALAMIGGTVLIGGLALRRRMAKLQCHTDH